MTAKRVPPKNEPPPPPKLTVSRAEAEKRIGERIEIGNTLFATKINSMAEYETQKQKYYVWHEYNTELLRRIFDSEEISRNYGFWGGSVYAENLTDKIKYLLEDTQSHVHRLESIKERLPLYPEPSLPAVSTPTISGGQTERATKEVFIVHGSD
jgi:hypothetical protein